MPPGEKYDTMVEDRKGGSSSGSSFSSEIRPDPPPQPTIEPTQSRRERAVAAVRIVQGNAAYNEALMKEPPRAFSKTAFILHAACLIAFLCSTMNGYDGSLLNGLFSNPEFKAYFGGSNNGLWAGIVSSIYQIGGVSALPFVGPVTDTFGRRFGMFVGAFIIVVGTVIQSTTSMTGSLSQFMAGRFFVGFGVNIVSAAGPIYVTEICHPAFRGSLTALYNTFWFVGDIVASGSVRGSLDLGGLSSWSLPLWLQALFSGFLVAFAAWLPESPRWLFVNNRREEAQAMITHYHGEGNPDSIWVTLQLQEYEEYLRINGADRRWWDYRCLVDTRSSRYRLLCSVLVAVFGQWAGSAIISYFLAAALDTAGITDPTTQLNINIGLSCTQFVFAIAGALSVDKFGRRPLLIGTNLGCAAVWLGMAVATSQFAADPTNAAAAKATQALIYLFGMVFSFGFTPLQILMPVEVLSFEMRAKGMAASQLAMNLSSLVNQFACPIALKTIGWRTYVIFMIWCTIQATIVYLIIPETKKRTLEELDLIFTAKNPRKASLEKKKLALDDAKNVLDIEDA